MDVRLKATPGIYLVGFMGSGKSTIGRVLAQKLGWDFVDLDEEIERHAACKITEIFDQFGEPAFRVMEHQALVEQVQQVRQGRARVIALGGGAFAEERNQARLASSGVSIFIDSPVDKLWERVAEQSDRPLARDRSRFEELYRQRRPHYEKADFTVQDEGAGAEAVVASILTLSLL